MGGDLSLPHYVVHSISFVTNEAAEAAGQRFAAYDFDDVSIVAAGDGTWILHLGSEQVLNARHLERTRSAMERLAAESGGSYEDWDVAVQMDGWPNCGCDWPD